MNQKEALHKISSEIQSFFDISSSDWLTLKPYFDYLYDVANENGYKEGFAEGCKKGRKIGYGKGCIKGYSKGFIDGKEEGSAQYAHRHPVNQIKNGKIIKTFPSITHAANKLGVDKSCISKAVIRKRPDRKGFHWELSNQL